MAFETQQHTEFIENKVNMFTRNSKSVSENAMNVYVFRINRTFTSLHFGVKELRRKPSNFRNFQTKTFERLNSSVNPVCVRLSCLLSRKRKQNGVRKWRDDEFGN